MGVVPVSKTKHKDKGWSPIKDFLVARKSQFASIGLREASAAALDLPMAFKLSNGEFHLVAVMSLHKNTNIFITTTGQWIGGYIPLIFQEYPFFFVIKDHEKGNGVLCIDDQSDRLVESNDEIAFFGDDGEPTERTKLLLNFLQQNTRDRKRSNEASKQLSQLDLLEEWKINVQVGKESHLIEGLFKINEKKLNELDDKKFLELRRTGALFISYAQLISMAHTHLFKKLYEAQHQHIATVQKNSELGQEIFNSSSEDTLNFNF